VGSTVVKHRFWTANALLEMFDPDGRKKTTSGGIIRALKRSGSVPVGIFTTKDGVNPLWDMRPGATVADPAKAYDAERGFLRPSEPVVRAVKSSTKGKAK
jgi:type IV secretory pathway protease TraF